MHHGFTSLLHLFRGPHIYIFVFILVLILPWLCLAWTRRDGTPHTQDRTHARDALQALLTVITPACSLWPARYTSLVKEAGNNCILLPLNMLIQDVLDGIVEFRNPLHDLADLIASGFEVKNWNICVRIEPRLWFDVLEFWISHGSDKVLGLLEWPVSRSSSDPSYLVCPFMAPEPANSHINLDCQALSSIVKMIPGTRLTLEFTSLSPAVRPYTVTHVLAMLPFVLCSRYSTAPLRRPRKLSYVLEMLGAMDRSITVHSATNLSTVYLRELEHAHEKMTKNGELRKIHISTFGIRRWRCQRFCLALEAALVCRGLLEKWAIEVSISE